MPLGSPVGRQDVPNCDDPAAKKKCSTGSLAGDTAAWFGTLARLGLNGTWGVWDFVDGGLGDANQYGDARNDGAGLSPKGLLHRAQALRLH